MAPEDEQAGVETGVDGATTSLWAVASILVALGFLCPPTALLAPMLGIRALVEIRANPQRRGRRLALAGITIGLIAGAGWLSAGLWWNTVGRRPMLQGPRTALLAGFAGDIAGFKDGFTGDAAAAGDLEAAEFLQTLSDRYGQFLGSEQAPDEEVAQGVPDADDRRLRIAYVLSFQAGPVDAEAEFVLRDPDSGKLVLRFAWLVVRDDEAGDLVYPKTAQGIADKTTPVAASP